MTLNGVQCSISDVFFTEKASCGGYHKLTEENDPFGHTKKFLKKVKGGDDEGMQEM
jgi:hypothetical protein